MNNAEWRHHFAGQAMQGLLANPSWAGTMSEDAMRDIAIKSVMQADLLIGALKNVKSDPYD